MGVDWYARRVRQTRGLGEVDAIEGETHERFAIDGDAEARFAGNVHHAVAVWLDGFIDDGIAEWVLGLIELEGDVAGREA